MNRQELIIMLSILAIGTFIIIMILITVMTPHAGHRGKNQQLQSCFARRIRLPMIAGF